MPADANARDNTAYFVYGPDTSLLAEVISDDRDGARDLQFAGRAPATANRRNGLLSADFPAANLDAKSLLIWQAPLPAGGDADRVQSFAAQGGMVIFFPPGRPDPGRFNGMGWGAEQTAEGPEGFRVVRWNEDEGPLAKSDEHPACPSAKPLFAPPPADDGSNDVLAAFDDGTAFLVRQSFGKGEIYFCSSLPDPAWSSLGDGPVLVPMLQRMLQAGARRLQQVASAACGELSAPIKARPGFRWIPPPPRTFAPKRASIARATVFWPSIVPWRRTIRK